jgi:dTDP-4-dehydrorhamnose 3,5-epimerase-like enzyme
MSGRLSTIADAMTIDLPRHARDDGALVVAEALTHVPFAIVRMFTIQAPAGAVRGEHAHRRCSQFMICVSGVVEFSVDDGGNRKTCVLDRGNQALLVPPMLWQSVACRVPSVLIGLCDRPYEEDDYIRDYAAFLETRKAAFP